MPGSLCHDHYRVLGIGREASLREVRRAYRERVKVRPPTRTGQHR